MTKQVFKLEPNGSSQMVVRICHTLLRKEYTLTQNLSKSYSSGFDHLVAWKSDWLTVCIKSLLKNCLIKKRLKIARANLYFLFSY
jgi:hypothetical protein